MLSCLLVLALSGLTLAFYRLLRAVPPACRGEGGSPLVSVVVPARNEEGKIGRCLSSLLAQDYPNLEIIVVDDRSTDRTAEIIEEFARRDARVRMLRGTDLPEGWIGKCNALAHASAKARGDWLIFTDADTFHKPNSLADAVSFARENGADLVSFVPVQELGSFWERVVMPTLLGSFLCGDPFHTVNDQESSRAYAYGQYIIVRHRAYLALGGHRAVRDEIVEDHALGRLFKANGYKILVGDGKRLYSVRMYVDGETLWQGWTKNLYSLIECRLENLVIVLALINCATVLPFAGLLTVLWLMASGQTEAPFAPLAAVVCLQLAVLFLWYRLTTTHYAGVGLRHFFLLPLGGLTVTALYFHAAYLVLSGTAVSWKGRKYKVGVSRTIEGDVTPGESSLDKTLRPDAPADRVHAD